MDPSEGLSLAETAIKIKSERYGKSFRARRGLLVIDSAFQSSPNLLAVSPAKPGKRCDQVEAFEKDGTGVLFCYGANFVSITQNDKL